MSKTPKLAKTENFSFCQLSPESVVAELRALRGTRYAHQGRDPRHGFDCIGLFVYALLRCGWKPRNPESLEVSYDPEADDNTMERLLKKEGREVKTMRPGDVLLIRWKGQKFAQHIAMVTEIREKRVLIIHTLQKQGVREHGLSADWAARVVGIYRLKDFK